MSKVIDLTRRSEERSRIRERELRNVPAGMRVGLRQCNEASLEISHCQAVPEHMRENVREIINFEVPAEKRGQKLGTMLLNFVCQEADADKKTLLLTAYPTEDHSEEAVKRLVAWYERFGFICIQASPTGGWLMARQVRERSRIVNEVPLAVQQAVNDVRI